MKKTTARTGIKKRRKLNPINIICWIIIPIAIIVMLVMDGFGLYTFNTERIIVIGIDILVMLLPFFSEITVKNFSFKRKSNSK